MRTVLLTLTVLIFFSCEEKNTLPDNPMIGKWSLVKVAFFGPSESYEKGAIIWKFDAKNNIRIEMGTMPRKHSGIHMPFKKSGVFSFKCTPDATKITQGKMFIEGTREWCTYQITDHNNALFLNYGMEYDGTGYFFKRAD